MSFFGYVKLFQSILGSSVWVGPDAPLRVWITMLVLKNKEHEVVGISVPGLANLAKVSLEECQSALVQFKSPDPMSTSKEYDGRKIEDLPDGGWLILNGEKYAQMLSHEERKAYQRQKMKEYRQNNNRRRYGPQERERQYVENGGQDQL